MTAVDEQTESIGHLDFTPPCEWKTSREHPAQLTLTCFRCRATAFICRRHFDRMCRRFARERRAGLYIVCTACGRESACIDQAMEVWGL